MPERTSEEHWGAIEVEGRGLWMPELVLYGIRLLALGKVSTNESAVMSELDQ